MSVDGVLITDQAGSVDVACSAGGIDGTSISPLAPGTHRIDLVGVRGAQPSYWLPNVQATVTDRADTNVRVNCVTPAAVESPMFAQMTQAHIDYMLSKIPMNRFGTVDEIAALVTWLCTEECSFSTGAVFDLSGGRSTY